MTVHKHQEVENKPPPIQVCSHKMVRDIASLLSQSCKQPISTCWMHENKKQKTPQKKPQQQTCRLHLLNIKNQASFTNYSSFTSINQPVITIGHQRLGSEGD